MSSVMRTVAALLSGGVLLVLAGSAQDEVQPAIERLLSPDVQEVVQARDEILAARAKLIAELLAIVDNDENRAKRSNSVAAAMYVLGEMRATEAIAVLLKHVEFKPRPDISSPVPWWEAHRKFPAVKALVQIGEPCIPPIVKKLGEGTNRSCLGVLIRLRDRQAVAHMLEDAIQKERDPDRRKWLTVNLNTLSEIDMLP